ncbi:peptidoglycan DD-metalloendopeptidase family protein [Streptomyces sp. NPDC048718]|uniref:M23 family metallopeptidase n=1 Tax=Streptomyces sp. NPDC048718 TaxID=3365587 RepID=UPI0037157E84
MPAKGKHRRRKARPFSRGIVAASAGGAVVALPLIGATGAHAAERAVPAAMPRQAPAATPASAPATAPRGGASAYTVVPGDHLSKIAAEHRLAGGWHRLYHDNRKVVGENPSLIFPGMKLVLGATHTGQATTPKAAASQSVGRGADSVSTASASASRGAERVTASAAGASTQASTPAPSVSASASSSASTTVSTGTSASVPAGTTASSGATASSGWVAPVSGGTSTPYRASGSMWSSGYHTGVDFMAATGTTVRAVGPGTVYSAGWGGSYGNQVVIKHADGTYSQYAHLSSISVSAGQTVTGGQQIGLSGATGNVTGPHLHFEMRTGPDYGSDIDPLAALRQHGVAV